MHSFSSFVAVGVVTLTLFHVAVPMGQAAAADSVPSAAGASSGKVIIISVDGLRPAFYSSPTFKKLIGMGASADGAESIYPSITYPAHTSIVTGVSSAKHGIFSNTIFSMEKGSTAEWYWDSKYLTATTLWQATEAQGKTAAILTWPVSVGAKVHWLVPELFPGDPAAKESTWDLMRKNTDPAFLKELVEKNGGKILSGFEQRDEWISNAAVHMIREYHPDLMLIHLINLDHVEHDSGKEAPQTLKALELIDADLAKIVDAIDFKNTTLIVLGDHGFYDYDKVINLNSLFVQQGWLKEDYGSQISPDWKVQSHLSGGIASVYSRDPSLNPQIIALLKRHAGKAYRVIERPELDRLQALPGAVCAVEPATSVPLHDGKEGPGYSVGKEAHGPLIINLGRVRGNHGPMPTDPQLRTGLIAVGPGITPGKKLGQVKLLDVAPTAARILGITMPAGEGHPLF
jgi:predicted AlkP superfamily pyrophosphatase or phosphodiesterase